MENSVSSLKPLVKAYLVPVPEPSGTVHMVVEGQLSSPAGPLIGIFAGGSMCVWPHTEGH